MITNELKLYTLLCGPILRRIEPKKVCIWLATSIQPESVFVSIFLLTRKKNEVSGKKEWETDLLPTDTNYNVHQLGGKLFVILLEVTPLEDNSFLEKTLYGYDINFTFREADKVVLNQKHFYSKDGGRKEFNFSEIYNYKKEYTYADIPYPVIVIPNQNKPNSRILYGSCRKTQGSGSDALNASDTLLEEEWTAYFKNQSSRSRIPDYSLFHLGDQIYADDLHDEVFKFVRMLADALMGYDEYIPAYKDIKELTLADLKNFLTNYLNGDRRYKLEDLNLLTRVVYDNPDRRKNIVLFLKSYYSTSQKLDDLFVLEKLDDLFYEFLDSKEENSLSSLIDKLDELTGSSINKIDLNEILPRKYLLEKLTPQNVNVYIYGYENRRDFLRIHSSFSTDDQGHLLSFGEFAALYLIHWGNFGFVTILTNPNFESNNNLEGIIHGNRKVKRLFANVPSYMIFDDQGSPIQGSPIHFELRGKLRKYSAIINEDSLLIPHNNVGLVDFFEMNGVHCINQFLYSEYYDAPIVKAHS